MALWQGSDALWARLLASIRGNCGKCREELHSPLCAEHRRLVNTDQKFLDGMLASFRRRDELVSRENSRRGGVSRG